MLEDVQDLLDALGTAVYRGHLIQATPGSYHHSYVIYQEGRRICAYFQLDLALRRIDIRIARQQP